MQNFGRFGAFANGGKFHFAAFIDALQNHTAGANCIDGYVAGQIGIPNNAVDRLVQRGHFQASGVNLIALTFVPLISERVCADKLINVLTIW